MENPFVNPHCPRCDGAGFLHPVNEFTQKVLYNQLVPCDYPGCYKENLAKGMPLYNRTTGVARDQTFDNFKLRMGAEESFKAAKSLADGSAEFIFLVMYGGVGCGKTHLCNAIVMELLQRGLSAKLIMVSELLDYLRKGIEDHTLDDRLKRYKNIHALALDDFKTEYIKTQGWALDKIEEIIDSRYREMKLTILTTNDEFQNLPDRIVSRFSDRSRALRVLNSAGDYRPLGN